MELPFRHVKWEHRKRISGYVSILVLMELPFRPLLLSLIDRFVIGFNPCFNGIAFSTRWYLLEQIYCSVSILVLMELPFRL